MKYVANISQNLVIESSGKTTVLNKITLKMTATSNSEVLFLP